MTKLLLRLFVRDRDNTEDPTVRGKYGTLAGFVGIFWFYNKCWGQVMNLTPMS